MLWNPTEAHRWFDQKRYDWGFRFMIPFIKIHDNNEGYLLNDELIVVAEIDVLQVVGTLEKSEETNPLSNVKVSEFYLLH